jgi:hypothetical protein
MILAALLAMPVIGYTAADFFPLPEGRRATYEEKSLTFSVTTDVIGKTVTINHMEAVQVTTLQNSKEISFAFYKVDNDAVWLVAYSKENPLPTPMPIFKIGEKKTTWEYAGITGIKEGAEGMHLKGESQLKPARDVLGQKVECLEVKITATVGGGASREIVEQVATYGKGIGLVELTSKTRVGKRSVDSSLKLIKVENAGG